MSDAAYATVPVEHDPWDASPPVPSITPSGGLGIPASSGFKPVDRLFGLGGEERYQLWPERMLRSGLSAPHDALSGELQAIDPETGHTSNAMIERANDMAGTVALGTAPAPAAARGSAGVFLGPMGKRIMERQSGQPLPEHPVAVKNIETAAIKDQGMREAQAVGALQMREAAGLPTKDIFDNTGWFVGKDGAVRREIPDLNAKLVPAYDAFGNQLKNKFGNEYKWEHPAGDIHKAYDLPNITVGMGHPDAYGGGAHFYPATRQIVVHAPDHTKAGMQTANSIVPHEVQHAIQLAEGMPLGSSPQQAPLYREYHAGVDDPDMKMALAGEMRRSLLGIGPTNRAIDIYNRISGEVEARNVEARRKQGYRYLSHPEVTEDIPRSQQLEPYNSNSIPNMQKMFSYADGGGVFLEPVDHDPFI